MKRWALLSLIITATLVSAITCTHAAGTTDVFRIGMIGLDTSHVLAFTKHINDPANNTGCKVVLAYKGGSPDIPSSANRIDKFTARLREQFGVEIVDSIDELCTRVDGVMLMSVDGRPHLEQAKPVIEAGLPLWIDKPLAGNLADAVEIFRRAEKANVPCWTSSSLRFSPGIIGMRNHKDVGDVVGCDAYSPCELEEHHPDLYWYGIHGVEILFTIMGTGCEEVQRVQTDGTDYVVGVWDDGRVGTFRGIRQGKKGYGAMVFGTKGIAPSGQYAGYGHLAEKIVKFFKTGDVAVPPGETLEMFAFMTAADISKTHGGKPVSVHEVLKDAKQKVDKRMK